MTLSERWFQRYLIDHGYGGAHQHEPDLGIATRPDFFISKAGDLAVCEIKEFETAPLQRRADAMDLRHGRPVSFTASDREVYGPVRQKVHAAARQMRDLRDRGVALVAVLANPLGLPIDLGVSAVAAALYGNPGYGGSLNRETGTIENMAPILGRDGELTNDHRELGAVVLLRRREHAADARDAWLDANRDRINSAYSSRTDRMAAVINGLETVGQPDGDYFYVDVIHTTSAWRGDAVPVPGSLFAGPRDQQWAVDLDGAVSPLH
jgi:hypothetical protein